jgi:hypothetical protein
MLWYFEYPEIPLIMNDANSPHACWCGRPAPGRAARGRGAIDFRPILPSAWGQTRSSERFRFMSAQAPKAELQAT